MPTMASEEPSSRPIPRDRMHMCVDMLVDMCFDMCDDMASSHPIADSNLHVEINLACVLR